MLSTRRMLGLAEYFIEDSVSVRPTILAFTRRGTSSLAERGGAEKGAGA
jgi:hypothetical protein